MFSSLVVSSPRNPHRPSTSRCLLIVVSIRFHQWCRCRHSGCCVGSSLAANAAEDDHIKVDDGVEFSRQSMICLFFSFFCTRDFSHIFADSKILAGNSPAGPPTVPLGFVRFGPPPPSRPPSPPSKVDLPQVASLLLHHALILQQLIVVLDHNFLVSSSPVARHNSHLVAALHDCIGLQYFFNNLIDVPSADALIFLHLMGPPDPHPDFLPTHSVLRVVPRPFSLAPVGFIHNTIMVLIS